MSAITIRPYHSGDKPDLLKLLGLNIPKYFANSELSEFEHYLDHEVEDYFVVVNGNEIVGAGGINLEKDQKIGKISWDFLHPVHQGQGIGTQLLQHRLNILRKNPLVNRIIVRTSQYAEKFYAKNGFKLIGVQKNYWAPGFDLYKMEI